VRVIWPKMLGTGGRPHSAAKEGLIAEPVRVVPAVTSQLGRQGVAPTP